MKLSVYEVSAFTERPEGGNPAAVVPLEAWLPEGALQAKATNLGLPVTAFLVPAGTGWDLRWFTPTGEVDLCGHGTLAAAHVLREELGAAAEELRFRTPGGDLVVRPDAGRIELDLPAHPPGAFRSDDVVQHLLGITPYEDLLGGCEPRLARATPRGSVVMAALLNESEVRRMAPPTEQFAAAGIVGLAVTAPGTDVDFVSRYFFADTAGGAGGEDPVTGSAHCTLAPFWAVRLGKDELRARQVSARGGELWCRVVGERVRIAGHAITTRRRALAAP